MSSFNEHPPLDDNSQKNQEDDQVEAVDENLTRSSEATGDQGDNLLIDAENQKDIEPSAEAHIESAPRPVDAELLDPATPASGQFGSYWQGPVPPPEIIKSYDNVINNGAERVFALTEREQQHRHQRENRSLDLEEKAIGIDKALAAGSIKRSNAAMVVVSVLASALILGGFKLIDSGKAGSGVAAFVTPVAGLLIALSTRSTRQRTKLDDPPKETDE